MILAHSPSRSPSPSLFPTPPTHTPTPTPPSNASPDPLDIPSRVLLAPLPLSPSSELCPSCPTSPPSSPAYSDSLSASAFQSFSNHSNLASPDGVSVSGSVGSHTKEDSTDHDHAVIQTAHILRQSPAVGELFNASITTSNSLSQERDSEDGTDADVFASPEARSVQSSFCSTPAVPAVNLPPTLQSALIEVLPPSPPIPQDRDSISISRSPENVDDSNSIKDSSPTSDSNLRVIVPTVVPTINISRPLPHPHSSTTFYPASKPIVPSVAPITNTTSHTNVNAHFPTQSNRSPNVYINGLPPYYPEEQLYALTAPFGGVRSVRSFTRHVGEKCSGYGFVLFDSVEAAEKCIESLRRYRNLHPSFSKQVHKIPGTAYASHSSSLQQHNSHCSSLSSFSETEFERGNDDGGEEGGETFKAKMDRLRDETSTNLYIEGLPLSIDEPTLAALVSPYHIKSSRFFETKLSHPPRIIAFVRLETREAAEEIIERLHGRMVRGWNDPGSRISVRFADTSEQRELRRTERSLREDEQSSSPARITIAQAALLNLRGPELNQPESVLQAHNPLSSSSSFNVSAAPGAYEFAPVPNAVTRHLGDEYASSHLPARLPPTQLPYHHHHPHHQQPQEIDSDMVLLLDSLRGNIQQDYRDQARRRAQALADMRTVYPNDVMIPQLQQHVQVETQAQAHNGFTPAEELIFHAHTQMQARGGHGLARGVPVGRAGGSYQQQGYSLEGQMGMVPPPTAENTFHANAQAQTHLPYQHSYQQPQQHFDSSKARHNPNIHPAHVNARLSVYDQHQQQQRQEQQQQHNASSIYSNVQSQVSSYNNHNQTSAHMRSTTLPPPLRSTASHPNNGNNSQNQRHYQQHQNSISLPTNPSNRATNLYSTANGLNTNNSNNTFFGHHDIQHDDNVNHPVNTNNKYNSNNNYENNDQYAHHQFHHADNYDIDVSSPPIISPTLTYNSSRTTPSTLSPATPFFGSFVPAGVERFENGYTKMRVGSQ